MLPYRTWPCLRELAADSHKPNHKDTNQFHYLIFLEVSFSRAWQRVLRFWKHGPRTTFMSVYRWRKLDLNLFVFRWHVSNLLSYILINSSSRMIPKVPKREVHKKTHVLLKLESQILSQEQRTHPLVMWLSSSHHRTLALVCACTGVCACTSVCACTGVCHPISRTSFLFLFYRWRKEALGGKDTCPLSPSW